MNHFNHRKKYLILFFTMILIVATNTQGLLTESDTLSETSYENSSFFQIAFIKGTITNYSANDSIIQAHASHLKILTFQPFNGLTLTNESVTMIPTNLGRITPTQVFGIIRIHIGSIDFKYIKDTTNDVTNLCGRTVTVNRHINVENIDITSAYYMRDQTQICVALQVEKRIANRGSYEELNDPNLDRIHVVNYNIILTTNQRTYSLEYINHQTTLHYFDTNGTEIYQNITTKPIRKNLLLYTFELENTSETYAKTTGISTFIKTRPGILPRLKVNEIFDEISDQLLL